MVRRFSSRPEAAPCCGVLVRAALVDKSLKRHVTITVSGPVIGVRGLPKLGEPQGMRS